MILRLALALLLLVPVAPSPGRAADAPAVLEVEGARILLHAAPPLAAALLGDDLGLAPGDRLAFLEIDLAPGWKTYWRLPGRFGLPPHLDWSPSTNLAAATVLFPAPLLFAEADGQSVGYDAPVLWPLVLTPADPSRPVTLRLDLEIGLCATLCVPVSGSVALGEGTVPLSPARLGALVGRLPRLATTMPADATAFWVLEGENGVHRLLPPGTAPVAGDWRDLWPADTTVPPLRAFAIVPGAAITVHH